jgi:hypothetical protein
LCFTFKKFNLKNITFKNQLYEYSHAYLNEPFSVLGKFTVYIYFRQLTKFKAHALSVKVLRFESKSKTQSKWVIGQLVIT